MSKTLVIGSGISGISAANLLAAKGVVPVIFDGNEELVPEDIMAKLEKGVEAEVYVGILPEYVIAQLDEVVLSPGVPIDSKLVVSLKNRGLNIIGEVELAYRYDKGKVLAITGTNGKTTTTSLLGKIMSDRTHNAFVVGNIGNPYTEEVFMSTKDSVTVAEISSFQLETIETFRPHVSAILNITPDHLNRHHTMECYIETKEKITMNQGVGDYVVLNYEDEELRRFGDSLLKSDKGVKPFYFSAQSVLEEGMYLDGDTIILAYNGKKGRMLKVDEMQIIGTHNVENAMAAMAMAFISNVPCADIIKSVKEFKAVAHRIEFVAEKNGVKYYNDSKGTNVDAAIKGIRAMNRPTFLIGGGYDKGASYDEWIDSFMGKVKKLVLIGQTKEAIAACAQSHGFRDYVFAQSLEEAVRICAFESVPGDAVLLSPACASWGMFKNFEERGDMFKELVEKL